MPYRWGRLRRGSLSSGIMYESSCVTPREKSVDSVGPHLGKGYCRRLGIYIMHDKSLKLTLRAPLWFEGRPVTRIGYASLIRPRSVTCVGWLGNCRESSVVK